MATKKKDTPKGTRAAHRKGKRASEEKHKGQVFASRKELADAVRDVAMHRLWTSYGIPWHPLEEPLAKIVRSVVKIPMGPEGRGRRADTRARFVYQMERKDLVGAALCSILPEQEYEKLRGVACTKTELALFWLLIFGAGPANIGRELARRVAQSDGCEVLEGGMTAGEIIERETATMKRYQAPDRHGYPDTWARVREGDADRPGDRVVDLDAGNEHLSGPKRGVVRLRKTARKPRGHRPPTE